MTLEEACRLIDPATDLSELDKMEYYHGFNGKDAAAAALREASQMVVDFVRRMQWHDAKTPPPVHEECWESAGEKHCSLMSNLVWVCCEGECTMKGWVENGVWYLENGCRADGGVYGSVKLWAPLLEPPEVMKMTDEVDMLEALSVLDHKKPLSMLWRNTKTDPPKKEDADQDGKVLVWRKDLWTASMSPWYSTANGPDYYPYWMPLPEPPEVIKNG